jgi:hypothetical protein
LLVGQVHFGPPCRSCIRRLQLVCRST